MSTLLFPVGTQARGKMACLRALFERGNLAERHREESLVVALLG